MTIHCIHSPSAPAAIGPYSHGVVFQNTLYSSGQIALSPETGELMGKTVEEQTQQCLKNLYYVVKAAGGEKHTIIKVNLFLTNMNDFKVVNELYELWIGGHRPARTTIAVASLPKGALIEIECIAQVNNIDGR